MWHGGSKKTALGTIAMRSQQDVCQARPPKVGGKPILDTRYCYGIPGAWYPIVQKRVTMRSQQRRGGEYAFL